MRWREDKSKYHSLGTDLESGLELRIELDGFRHREVVQFMSQNYCADLEYFGQKFRTNIDGASIRRQIAHFQRR